MTGACTAHIFRMSFIYTYQGDELYMKIKKVAEEFTSAYNKHVHYDKHITKYKEFDLTIDEYERAAEELALTPIDNVNIFGYISETPAGKTAYCKYDKAKKYFTVYTYNNFKPLTITMHKKEYYEYLCDKMVEFHAEMPFGY